MANHTRALCFENIIGNIVKNNYARAFLIGFCVLQKNLNKYAPLLLLHIIYNATASLFHSP